MDKAKKLSIEKALCEYLAKNFRGANNPVSSKTIESAFSITGRTVRDIINSLRSSGEPICSNYDGYFYADNPMEISATVAQLSSRIQKIAQARDGLLNRNETES